MTLFGDLPLPSRRVRLLVAYHGKGFRGLAPQPGQRTVVGVLAEAVGRVLRIEPPAIAMSGRTDAGVHAWGQVLSLDAPEGADIGGLARRLTKMLGPEIVVRSADAVSADFDARHSATGRTYRYTLLNREVPDPFLAETTWWVPDALDVRAMQAGCDPLLGTHDFGAFCRRQGEASLVREVRAAEWVVLPDGLMRFEVEASSFCQQMVRSLVGTLVDVGRGRRTVADVMAALRHPDRANAGPVAPPHGLCLWRVDY